MLNVSARKPVTHLQQVLGPAFLISLPIWKMKKDITPIKVAISKHHLGRGKLGQGLIY